jgi:hypothetical protein
MLNKNKALLYFASLAFALTAHGATITYNNRPLWQSSVSSSTPLTSITFAGIAGTGETVDVSSGFQVLGVAFAPTTGSQLIVADRDAPGYDFGVPAVLSAQLGFPAGFIATFVNPTTSFGVSFTGFLGDASTFTARVQRAGGIDILQFGNGTFPPAGFFGVISTELIQSVTFSSAPADGVFWNFTHNGVAPANGQVPEPATYALAAAALLGILRFRRC